MEDVIVNEVTDWVKLNCPFLKLSLSEFYILIRYITLLLSYCARSECHIIIPRTLNTLDHFLMVNT